MKKRSKVVALIALICTLGLTGCSSNGSALPGTPEAGTVTLNITSEPTELNPMKFNDVISQSVLAHVMSGFTRLDEQDNPVADLAEKWDISEDKMTYTMYLRKDAVWSNGDKVTVKDFYYSWVQQMIPSTGSLFASFLYNHIENGVDFYNGDATEDALGLHIIDDYTLEIKWAHPMVNGLYYLSLPCYLPVNQGAYEEIGEKAYAKEADQMVTNGAYKMTEWVHNANITLEKSEDYFDADNIPITTVKLAMIKDSDTALNALKTGEIDLTSIYGEQIDQVKAISEEAVHSYEDGGTWYLDFNVSSDVYQNVNLRKALSYAIDTQSLLDNVIKDGSVAADGIVPHIISGEGGKSYAKTRGSLFAYNKEEAVKYLDKALEELKTTKEDLKLTFYQTDTTYNQNQAAYLQQQWKTNLGIDVELKTLANKALTEAKMNGDYTFTVSGWGPNENDAITFLETYLRENQSNYGRYDSEAYNQFVNNAMAESDSAKRQEMMIAAEKLLMEDMVIGPLYFTHTTYALSSKYEGIIRTPFQFFNVRYASSK